MRPYHDRDGVTLYHARREDVLPTIAPASIDLVFTSPPWQGGSIGMSDMLLSVFPGIDLLGRAFEEVWPEACLVRGPDLLWGGDIRRFHPPAGVFGGVIGGPPCQAFSRLRYLNAHMGHAPALNLIPEFERVVAEARPEWFLMENVPDAPEPVVAGYAVAAVLVNNRWCGGEQRRVRRFSFGVPGREPVDLWRWLEIEALEPVAWSPTVMASGSIASGRRRSGGKNLHLFSRPTRAGVAESARLQGLPADFLDDSPLSIAGQQRVIGNGVPLPLGRAIARAVRAAAERGRT